MFMTSTLKKKNDCGVITDKDTWKCKYIRMKIQRKHLIVFHVLYFQDYMYFEMS